MRSFKVSSAALWAATILLPVVLTGCGGSGQSTQATSLQNAEPVESTAAKIGQMPSAEECREFAARLERAAIEGDIAAFNDAIDYDAMLESATGGIPGVEAGRKQFIGGVKNAVNSDRGFAAKVIQSVASGGSYVFLRLAEAGKQRLVRFRQLMPEGGLNYHDWILVREPGGRVKAVDVYVYISAEPISKMLRRSFVQVAASQSRSVLAKLASGESEYIKNLPKIEGMVNALHNGNHSQVQSIYDGLPPTLKKDKNILLLRFQGASASTDESQYISAIEDFRKYHPTDPCVAFISIDHYVMKKKFDEAIGCVKLIDKAVGGDPYLTFMQGNICNMKGDRQIALRLLREAIQADPTLQDPYWTLVEISLTEKDFDETNRLLDQLEQQFQLEITDLEANDVYAEYVKSPQYQKRLKSQQAK